MTPEHQPGCLLMDFRHSGPCPLADEPIHLPEDWAAYRQRWIVRAPRYRVGRFLAVVRRIVQRRGVDHG